MAHAIRLSDFAALDSRDRERALGELVHEAVAPVNGQAMAIKARIQSFEARYEMSTAQLLVRLRERTFAETAEISDWLFWVRLRDLSGGR